MLSYFLVIVGFVFLIKGADYLIDGATAVAKRLRISDLVVGLTIISLGTSAPELFVNISSSLTGNTDLAIGNILGSNIANILLILGITALFCPLKVNHDILWKDIPLSLVAVLLTGLLLNDTFVNQDGIAMLSRSDGFVLLCFCVIFLWHVRAMAKAGKIKVAAEKSKPRFGLPAAWGLIIVGLVGLAAGGQMVVRGAVALASQWGVSQSLIGLTIVAVGTSLPELVTSVVAALRQKVDIAVGNIIGSNILNVFFILGLSSVIRPLPFSLVNNFDLVVLTIATALLFVWLLTGRKNIMERWQGGVFVALYVVYVIALIIRG